MADFGIANDRRFNSTTHQHIITNTLTANSINTGNSSNVIVINNSEIIINNNTTINASTVTINASTVTINASNTTINSSTVIINSSTTIINASECIELNASCININGSLVVNNIPVFGVEQGTFFPSITLLSGSAWGGQLSSSGYFRKIDNIVFIFFRHRRSGTSSTDVNLSFQLDGISLPFALSSGTIIGSGISGPDFASNFPAITNTGFITVTPSFENIVFNMFDGAIRGGTTATPHTIIGNVFYQTI